MTHISPVLAVILTLVTCSVADASILCTWTKVLSNDEVHYSFLRSDPSSLRLYHSIWSRSHTLRSCSFSDNATLIRKYNSLCQENEHDFSHQPDLSFDFMFDEDELCASLDSPRIVAHEENTARRLVRSAGPFKSQDERSEVKTKLRVKRGFIVPGTLWCGSGNKAPSYADLGVFSETDKCCREHDQCKHTILSFHSQFGVFNSNIFTMSHCDCDNRFRSCLTEAKDSISDVVGYTFFNLLKMHCFEFSHRLQCTERNWFGMCKETKMALYAEVHPPTLYESDTPTDVNTTIVNTTIVNTTIVDTTIVNTTIVDTTIVNTTIVDTTIVNTTIVDTTIVNTTIVDTTTVNTTISASVHENVTYEPALFSITVESTVPIPVTNAPSITPETNVTSPTDSISSVKAPGPTAVNLDKVLPTKGFNQTLSMLDADITEKKKSCAVYKYLDECRNRILPLQRKYGLRNNEPRTMYHCNCTNRLFQTLAGQTVLTEVQALLLDHVSQSCFVLQDCTAGEICTVVVVRAELPQVEGSRGAHTEKERHLQAMGLRVRKPNKKRATRRAGKLHRLCLRMVLPKVHKSRRQHTKEAVRKRQE